MTTFARRSIGGDNLTEALAATNEFFPPLFCELVDVGEQSGHLAEVLRELAENYEHQITLRRKFRSEMSYPIMQLTLALLVVGGLIWVMGFINQMTGQNLDILQFGLVGTPGLIIYVSFLAAVGVGGFVLWQKIRRGALWTRPLQALIMRVPALSAPLNTLALSRLTWSLSVTLGAGMDLRQALALSLRSTHTWRFVEQIDPIWRSIRGGSELHEAMTETGVFPPPDRRRHRRGRTERPAFRDDGAAVRAVSGRSPRGPDGADAAGRDGGVGGGVGADHLPDLPHLFVLYRRAEQRH